MKIILLVILSYSISTIYADNFNQNLWVRVSSPVTKNLTRCIFTDTLNGWASGDSGAIVHTSNGGINWVSQDSKIDYIISNIFFLNPRLGWCISNDYYYRGTIILSTTNGGAVWNYDRYPDSSLIITDIHFVDSLTGFMSGYGATVLKTTNAGANWFLCSVENNIYAQFPMFKITFSDSQNGVACGGIMDIGGPVWRTTNGGVYWYTTDTLPVPAYNVKYFGNQNVFACGGEGDYSVFICKSTNAGSTWNNKNLGYSGIVQSIGFRTANEYWASLGYSQEWAVSTDSGNTWSFYPVPDSSGVFDIVFFDQNRGWAFGEYGSIYKYNPVIGITNHSTIASQFKLYQNYPNPFNPTTKIKFDTPLNSPEGGTFVRLIIYDILGCEVTTLVNQKIVGGTHSVEFDGSNLSSGIYFYKLEVTSQGSAAINYSESKKMIILK